MSGYVTDFREEWTCFCFESVELGRAFYIDFLVHFFYYIKVFIISIIYTKIGNLISLLFIVAFIRFVDFYHRYRSVICYFKQNIK